MAQYSQEQISLANDLKDLLDKVITSMFPKATDFIYREALKALKFKILDDVYSVEPSKALSNLKYVLKVLEVPGIAADLKALIEKHEKTN